MKNQFKMNTLQQNTRDLNEIINEILGYNSLDLEKKFRLLNEKAEKFVKGMSISRSKFRKYFDIFVGAIEKSSSEKDIKEKRKIYEDALLRCITLAKYDSGRQGFKGIENFYVFLKEFVKKTEGIDNEQFVKSFENLHTFLEACVAYMKEG